MKKLFLMALMMPVTAFAQNYNNGVQASDISMTASGAEMVLEMSLDVEPGAVTSLQGIALVPTLSAGSGENAHQAAFPYVLVNGKLRNQTYERQKKFGNTELMQNPPLKVMVIDRKHRGGKIDYSARIPGEPWMEGAELSLRFVLLSPAGERQYYTASVSGVKATAPEVSATPVVVPVAEAVVETPPVAEVRPVVIEQKPTPIVIVEPERAPEVVAVVIEPERKPEPVVVVVEQQPAPVTATPVAVATRRHTIEGTAYLDFETGSSALVTGYKRNPQELDVIRRAMSDVAGNPGARIVALQITGYSSPDGRADANETLARDRARALANYLRDAYRIPAGASTVRAIGEDWMGLRKMVAGSDIPYRSSVLEVIDGNEHVDAKESKLRRMMNGQIWQQMTDELFPELRRVEYKIDYEVAE